MSMSEYEYHMILDVLDFMSKYTIKSENDYQTVFCNLLNRALAQ